jgi:AcrR family transcriptional regulator
MVKSWTKCDLNVALATCSRRRCQSISALYSNFANKEDLFLALFEERIATDVDDYSQIVAEGTTLEEQARGAADHWMTILRERPDYFPLLIEFWAYALREPLLRERLAGRFAALRSASARLASEAAERWGFPASTEADERLGLFINALGNGLALEKLVDPDAVPDTLFGEMLALVFQAFAALVRQTPSSVDPDGRGSSQQQVTCKKAVTDCIRRSIAATGRACPPTWRRRASVAPRCMSVSDSSSPTNCVSPAARRCGSCSAPHAAGE